MLQLRIILILPLQDEHEMVSETAVVGFPHEMKGEGIFAFVVLKQAGANMDRMQLEKELKALCRSKIAGYAIPDFILVRS